MTNAVADVAIIGGGPAGLAAAAELKRLGIARVTLFEREASAGGVPRHCGHPPFGMREFGRILTGPAYARRLVDMAATSGAEIRLRTGVTGIVTDGNMTRIDYTSPDGPGSLLASRLLIATGTRESPRSARLLSGERPLGVINTGALQAYAYLEHLAPFKRPVIVGTELVALSAILTCRSIGAYPVAMIEEGDRPSAPSGLFFYPKLAGIPVLTGTRLVDIAGAPRVTHVTVETAAGARRTIDCDGVILSGKFVSESHLARLAGLEIDPGSSGPSIDQYGRTSNAAIFAAGNLLRPVETAGWSFREGRCIAGFIAEDLARGLPPVTNMISVQTGDNLRYVVPQRLCRGTAGLPSLQLRALQAARGTLVVTDGRGTLLYSRRISALPDRRITVPLAFDLPEDGLLTVAILPKT